MGRCFIFTSFMAPVGAMHLEFFELKVTGIQRARRGKKMERGGMKLFFLSIIGLFF